VPAAETNTGWRIAVVSMVLPIVEPLLPALRELGHEPVAWLLARRPDETPVPPWGDITDRAAPKGIDLLFPRDKWAVASLLRAVEPDLMLCWGFPWKLPQEALDVARLGSVNQHPGLLPRHRGPIPLAWAMRDGDPHFGLTWHRMDAELDTGAILAQSTVPIEDDDVLITQIGPKLIPESLDLLPQVFERVAAGDPGDPQAEEGATWAGMFEADYADVDWSRPAREVHNQVRAWHLTFGMSDVEGPIAELDGARVKLLQTSLTDPGPSETGDEARRVECGDGPIWIVASEPAEISG